MLYFAYGSNMSRERLERRTGRAGVAGVAMLCEYAHAFNKLGLDGSAKGNVMAAPGLVVYGVVYELTRLQFHHLASFEGGYRRIDVTVELLVHPQVPRTAVTFEADHPFAGIRPTAAYVSYYEQGMREHGLPRDYIASILAQADHAWPATGHS